jgi:hypothetical protein
MPTVTKEYPSPAKMKLTMLKKLQKEGDRHIQRHHRIEAELMASCALVDKKEGIYLVLMKKRGLQYTTHVPRKVTSKDIKDMAVHGGEKEK